MLERCCSNKNLIEKLPENNKIGIVKFESSTTLLTKSLIEDKEQAKHSNVKLYTVGLGTTNGSYFTNYLKPLANNTDGAFYLVADASQLEAIFGDINKKIDIETDSDGDGIADYYEDNMLMFNGVKLTLDKNNPDSDGDGLEDGQEVVKLDYQYNEDKTQVIVTGKVMSNPVEVDTDYDGCPDDEDGALNCNKFSGVLKTAFATSNVNFNMDYSWFIYNNKVYNEELSVISSLLSSAIYHDNTLSIEDSVKERRTNGNTMEEVMEYIGLNEVETKELDIDYNDIHLSEVALGYRIVTHRGVTKTVVAVVVRGTDGTIEEWSSNFYIGNIADYDSLSDWKTAENHGGFDIVANRIMRLVEQYVEEKKLDESNVVYWITGHSRGAAVANIIGAYYEDVGKTAYTYTFASPNTTLKANADSYKTIFNIVNADDFVPCLPMEAWGYSRYGRTANIGIENNYETEWENLTSMFDYDADTYGMLDTIEAMNNIINGDPRVDCYNYTCECHGDGSDDTITIRNYGTSRKTRREAIETIPNNALQYCIITKYEGGLFWGWDFEMCQTPAYFMQLLAAIMAKEIGNIEFALELDVAERYEDAKMNIILSYFSGIEHPHYTETYYLLSKTIKKGKFE